MITKKHEVIDGKNEIEVLGEVGVWKEREDLNESGGGSMTLFILCAA